MAVPSSCHIQMEIIEYYNALRKRMSALPELGEKDTLEMETVEPKPDRDYRSEARRLALQALYEMDAAHHSVDAVLSAVLETDQDLAKNTARYVRRLVRRVSELKPWLDEVIQHYAPAFPIEQIAIIDRNILRIAMYELLLIPTQPIGAVIDEAVELAVHFGADHSAAFVNGVLGTLVDDEARFAALRQRMRSRANSEDAQETSDT
jgi:N utilization substance protein B